MITPAMVAFAEAVDALCEELDRAVGRICRHHPILRLERESEKHWTVTDLANDQVMLRTPDRGMCVRFALAFEDKHPEARLDESFGWFASTALEGSGAPTAVEAGSQLPVPQAVRGEPASPEQFSVRVPDRPLAPVIQLPVKEPA